jgi:hypothetical protein
MASTVSLKKRHPTGPWLMRTGSSQAPYEFAYPQPIPRRSNWINRENEASLRRNRGSGRVLPHQVDVGEAPGGRHQVRWALPHHLVGDAVSAQPGIPGLRLHSRPHTCDPAEILGWSTWFQVQLPGTSRSPLSPAGRLSCRLALHQRWGRADAHPGRRPHWLGHQRRRDPAAKPMGACPHRRSGSGSAGRVPA